MYVVRLTPCICCLLDGCFHTVDCDLGVFHEHMSSLCLVLVYVSLSALNKASRYHVGCVAAGVG